MTLRKKKVKRIIEVIEEKKNVLVSVKMFQNTPANILSIKNDKVKRTTSLDSISPQ